VWSFTRSVFPHVATPCTAVARDIHRRQLMLGQREMRPRILVIQLYHGGHHPQHLECLLAYWAEHSFAGELHFVVSEPYREEHPALLAAVDATPGAERHLVSASNFRTNRRSELLSSDRRHGRVVSEWARRLEADHVLLMYLDHAQLSLACDLRFEWPLSISGIYFRPTFYYPKLGIHQGLDERVVAVRKRIVLRAALRNPHLRFVFCFDHLAVVQFPASGSRIQAIPLPEPLRVESSSTRDSPISNNVEPRRRRLLLFGSLDDRKGIRPVLDALSGLSEADQSQLALVLAGRVSGGERPALLDRIDLFRRSSNVQVVLEDRYLDEEEIQPLVRACDLVLLTYVHHVGSSGVLVRAASAGVPVLSTDYGLLGTQVRENRLGATLDATSVSAIRATLAGWLESPETIPFDPGSAQAFTAANTAEAFAETIFSRLLESPTH
jgi:glycosyltransferase involved in cell wall biosynthesis